MMYVVCGSCQYGDHRGCRKQWGSGYNTYVCPCKGDCKEAYEARKAAERQSNNERHTLELAEKLVRAMRYTHTEDAIQVWLREQIETNKQPSAPIGGTALLQ